MSKEQIDIAVISTGNKIFKEISKYVKQNNFHDECHLEYIEIESLAQCESLKKHDIYVLDCPAWGVDAYLAAIGAIKNINKAATIIVNLSNDFVHNNYSKRKIFKFNLISSIATLIDKDNTELIEKAIENNILSFCKAVSIQNKLLQFQEV